MVSLIRAVLRDLWAEILTPSPPDESAYRFAVIAIGHALLGAAFSFLGPLFPCAYLIVKEGRDLRRGGGVRDSLFDTFFVAVGLGYGADWWPLTVLALAGFGGVLKEAFRRL